MAEEKRKTKRMLPRRGARNAAAEITHDQVANAIKAFQSQGGLIKQLPPEVAERTAKVGYRWESVYEMPLQGA